MRFALKIPLETRREFAAMSARVRSYLEKYPDFRQEDKKIQVTDTHRSAIYCHGTLVWRIVVLLSSAEREFKRGRNRSQSTYYVVRGNPLMLSGKTLFSLSYDTIKGYKIRKDGLNVIRSLVYEELTFSVCTLLVQYRIFMI